MLLQAFVLFSVSIYPVVYGGAVDAMLILIALMALGLLRQWAATSVSSEKETNTIEPLAASPYPLKLILTSKIIFTSLCGLIWFALGLVLMVGFAELAGKESIVDAGYVRMYCAAVAACVIMLSVKGVQISATARDAKTAADTLMWWFVAELAALYFCREINEQIPELAGSLLFSVMVMALTLSVIYYRHLSGIHTGDLFYIDPTNTESHSVKAEEDTTEVSGKVATVSPRSKYSLVFAHEWRYLRTHNRMWVMCVVTALVPAGICAYVFYKIGFTGDAGGRWLPPSIIALNIAIISMSILTPRVSDNIVTTSIAAEKSTRTCESVISTPLTPAHFFFGKIAVPCVIELAMVLLSSVFLCVGFAVCEWYFRKQALAFYMFDRNHLISVLITLLTGVFDITVTCAIALKIKQSRYAVIISSVLGYFLIIPVAISLFAPWHTFEVAAAVAVLAFAADIIAVTALFFTSKNYIMQKL
ncbi:hypothetical protein FACS1894188_00010 [Clostridia bacterium]|nr:hypothetical protein FACS1894188_00010 [Clostridia bacterium]